MTDVMLTGRPIRAALYLRVSTGRQAESDLSIPDQRRQADAYCAAKGWQVASEYLEPSQSATDDRRAEFQRMMDAASERPAPFDVVLSIPSRASSATSSSLSSTSGGSPRPTFGWCRSPRTWATTR